MVEVKESPPREGSVTKTDTCMWPLTAPATGIDLTTSLAWESFQAMMHTMVATQQAYNSQSTRGARYLWDFKRYDPHTFSGIAGDQKEAQMWISTLETIFLFMDFSDD